MNKKNIIIMIIVTLMLLTSCYGESTGYIYYEDNINESTIEEIEILDNLFYQNIVNRDYDGISKMLTNSYLKQIGNVNEYVDTYAPNMEGQSYEYYDKYYINSQVVGSSSSTIIPSKDGDYLLSFPSTNGETFVSLMKFTYNTSEALLSLLYIKENNDWKIKSMYFNNYSFYSMNALELYKKSMELEKDGQYISAMLYTYLILNTSRPAPFMQYTIENEISEYLETLSNTVHTTYEMPMTLKTVDEVNIYGIDLETTSWGIMPVILYVSRLDPMDVSTENTMAIENEAHAMHEEVIELFKLKEKDYVWFLYRCYSEPPIDSNANYTGYGTMIESKYK